jgi:hypothetical protein
LFVRGQVASVSGTGLRREKGYYDVLALEERWSRSRAGGVRDEDIQEEVERL